MVIFESRLSARLTGRELEMPILAQLGKGIVVVQGVYLALRLQDLLARGVLQQAAFQPTFEAALFWTEVVVGSLLPAALLFSPPIRNSKRWLPFAATLVVLGFMLHRLDVSITAIQATTEVRYFPSLLEFMISAFLVVAGFTAFALAAKHLPVFPKHEEEPAEHSGANVVPMRRAVGH